MADSINILQNAGSVSVSPQFEPYSRVTINISDNTYVTAGDDTGRTLEFDNPFGTQQMAESILQKLIARGYQYQPYEAEGAILDPAAEMGDGVTVNAVYGGIYSMNRVFGRMMRADIGAPADKAINHEFKFETKMERQFKREVGNVKASLMLYGDRIEAKVDSDTSSSKSTFGWLLTKDSWDLYSNNNTVLHATSSGLEIAGTLGVGAHIGSGSGFTISAKAIYNGMASLDDTESNGVYVGTDGIALGGGKFVVTKQGQVTAGSNFEVDTNGNVTAKSLRLKGSLRLYYSDGETYETMTAGTLANKANSAYTSTSSGGYCYNGAENGYKFRNATDQNSGAYPGFFRASYLHCDTLKAGSLIVNNIQHTLQWRYMQGADGNYYTFLCG